MRPGPLLPRQPAAERRRTARGAEHRPVAGHHHPRPVAGPPAPQLQPRPALHRRRWGGGPPAPSQGSSGQTSSSLAPLAIPIVILGVPVLDAVFAVIRRAAGRSGLTV